LSFVACAGGSDRFVMFQHYHWSHCFGISHLFLLLDIADDGESNKQEEER
jgi:hypothetical protein